MRTIAPVLLLLLAPALAAAAPVDPVTTATMPPATDAEIRIGLEQWFPLGIQADAANAILRDRGCEPWRLGPEQASGLETRFIRATVRPDVLLPFPHHPLRLRLYFRDEKLYWVVFSPDK
jgi:hypothetical protein